VNDIEQFLRASEARQEQRHREIISILCRLERKEIIMSQELDALTASVANATTVEESAITLIQGLSAAIKAAGTDPVALAALTAKLDASDAALAAAVTANTPAAPAA